MSTRAQEIGSARTGRRNSRVTSVNQAGQDSDAQGLFNLFIERLGPLKQAFAHVLEDVTGGARDLAPFDYRALRGYFRLRALSVMRRSSE